MSGHGWVIPNENGSKARCGGPSLCPVCAKEKAQLAAVGVDTAAAFCWVIQWGSGSKIKYWNGGNPASEESWVEEDDRAVLFVGQGDAVCVANYSLFGWGVRIVPIPMPSRVLP